MPAYTLNNENRDTLNASKINTLVKTKGCLKTLKSNSDLIKYAARKQIALITMSNKKIIHLGIMDKFFILFILYLLNIDMLGIIPLYLLYC